MEKEVIISNEWQQALTGLRSFIASHPEIVVKQDSIIIPKAVRPEFYRHFNSVRFLSIVEALKDELCEAQILSNKYLEAEKVLMESIALSDISMKPSLQRFLHSPSKELAVELYTPLFDLLRAKYDAISYLQLVSKKVSPYLKGFLRDGFKKWLALALIKLLDPSKLFQCPSRQYKSPSQATRDKWGKNKEPIPALKETKTISFNYENETTLMLADFILYSNKIGRYISARSHFSEAFTTAVNPSEQREYCPINSIGTVDDELTLVYVDNNPENITLVADAKTICRPDLVLVSSIEKDWLERVGWEKVRHYHSSMEPKLGTYVICMQPAPKDVLSGTDDGIKVLSSVRFDESKLEPVIKAMAQMKE